MVRGSAEREPFGLAFRAAPIALAVLDGGACVRQANDAFATAVGRLAADMVGVPLVDLVAARYRPAEAAAVDALVAGRAGRHEAETALVRHDGSEVPCQLLLSAVRDDAGVLVQLVAAVADLAARRGAEGEVFRLAFEDAALGMAALGLDGRYQRVNPALCRILGRTEAELLALREHDVTHPDDAGSVSASLVAAGEGAEGSYATEKRYVRPDGSVVWALVGTSVVRDPSGRPARLMSQVYDVTERRRHRERELALTFEAAATGMWTWDPASGVMTLTPSQAHLLGLEPGAGPAFADYLAAVHPDDRAGLVSTLERSLATGRPYEREYRVRWHDGEARWLLDRGRVVEARPGRPRRMTGICTDITARRAVEAERAELSARQAEAVVRASGLQRVTAALAAAITVDEVAEVVLAEGTAVLGAHRGGVALLNDDGTILRLVGSRGIPADVVARWRSVPLQAAAPLVDVVRSRAAIYLEEAAEMVERYPSLERRVQVGDNKAWAFLPLATAERAFGTWALFWPEERRFSDADRLFLATLAGQCTSALERAMLRDAERAAAARAVAVQGVTAALSEALTVAQVTAVVAERVHPALGAAGLVVSVVEGDRLRVVRIEGHPEPTRDRVDDLDLGAEEPMAVVAAERQPQFYETVEQYVARFPDVADRVRASGKRSWAFLPLVVSGRAIGSWAISFEQERAFSRSERVLVTTLAGLCAQALERARFYEAQHDIATALQRTLLPATLPHVAGAGVATRYLPGGDGVEVGGDWFDLVPLDAERVAVVMGDVEGHSIGAAAVMGQLRSTLLAYAREGHPPAAVVDRSNRVLVAMETPALATCCYAEVDLVDGTATIVRAGHPPPLVLAPDGEVGYVDVEADVPLGIDATSAYHETTVFLEPGASLVLYTDGLVEGRTLPLLDGLEQLRTVAAGLPCDVRADPERLADHLLRATVGDVGRGDDVALLVLRYEPAPAAPGPPSVRRRLPAEPSSVALARRFSADVLAEWGSGDLADTVLLLVSELVTNALLHTSGDLEVHLALAPGRVRVEVADESERLPVPREADDDDTSGRGLFIVEALADAWGVDVTEQGKAVWFEVGRGAGVRA